MTTMKAYLKNTHLYLIIVIFIYAIITLISLNHCYFWDNIQQTAKEGYWFYANNFKTLLLPGFSEGSEIVGVGYHPPLMGFMTAILWKIFGLHLWVSHVFIFLWSIILAYNTFCLTKHLFSTNIVGLLVFVLLLDSAILAQIAMASPDIILLCSFVMAVRSIVENKKILLSISLIFLFLINARGTLAGIIVFIFYCFYSFVVRKEKLSIRFFITKTIPFLPALLLLISYFIYYFSNRGWILISADSPWAEGYLAPEGLYNYIKNIFAYSLRLVENGRIVIWLLGFYLIYLVYRKKDTFTDKEKSIGVLFILLFLLYLYFALTTRIAIATRYNMPTTFVLTLFIFLLLDRYVDFKRFKLISIVVICFLLSGNCWVYPDKIAKAWDSSLAHLPFYSLRNECLDYLDQNNIPYTDVSGGFCLYGNRRYVDLMDKDSRISTETENKYFLYSNISNLGDDFQHEIRDTKHWKLIKTFKKGMVYISIYQNCSKK
jgi:hypothetical protein